MALYRWNSDGFSDESASFSDIIFGFSNEPRDDHSSSNSSGGGGGFPDGATADENNSRNSEEKKKFWDSQNEILQATLYRTSSLETKIRKSTRDCLTEIENVGLSCVCGKADGAGCRNFLRREVSIRLRSRGYNCSICKSKWNGGRNGLLAGEHSYLEVVEESRKLGEVKVIIELNFRAEFEMAKASEEYNRLVSRLPEVFVGRVDRMKSLIKILCSAAKACMKEKKIYLAPWRKHKYMQSKWLGGGTVERVAPEAAAVAALTAGYSHRPAKAKASMLTYDLTESQNRGLAPSIMCLPAVRVV